jgi:predicted amidohydrolase
MLSKSAHLFFWLILASWCATATAIDPNRQELERGFAETIPGPTSRLMEALACELKIYLLAGSILEAIPGDARAHNTSLLFDPQGSVVARYRKIHLFDVDIRQEGRTVRSLESEVRKPGQEIVVADTGLCRMGLTVCYDLRFPELFRALVDRGAELVLVPSAFTALTGEAHWEPLLRARAIENQVYVVAPNQTGHHPDSFATHGHSLIVDPWGKILAAASDQPGVIYAEIDLDYLAKVRAELPALSHRRLSLKP